MKSRAVLVGAVVVLVCICIKTSLATTASFQRLGGLPSDGTPYDVSRAFGISADGSVVVGEGYWVSGGQAHGEAFRWAESEGMQALGDLAGGGFSSSAYAVSANGSVIVGIGSNSAGLTEAFRWTSSGGMVGLGDLPDGIFTSYGNDVSADGSVVVGRGTSTSGAEAFHWTNGDGMVGLGDLSGGGFDSRAWGVSADGSVVVGRGAFTSGSEAFRWTASTGMIGLGDLPGGEIFSRAHAVSADGRIIVGVSDSILGDSREAFRWTESGGMQGLGDLPGGDFYSWADDVSNDGSVVVGYSITSGQWSKSSQVNEAFIWNPEQGMRNLKNILENDFELDLTGWTLNRATGISDDGLTIVGYGINPDGYAEGWIATVPEPATLLLLGLGAVMLRRRHNLT